MTLARSQIHANFSLGLIMNKQSRMIGMGRKRFYRNAVIHSKWLVVGGLLGIMVLGTAGCFKKTHVAIMSEKELEQRQAGAIPPESLPAPERAHVRGAAETPEAPTAPLEGPTAVQPFSLAKEVPSATAPSMRPPTEAESMPMPAPVPRSQEPTAQAEMAQAPTPAPTPPAPEEPARLEAEAAEPQARREIESMEQVTPPSGEAPSVAAMPSEPQSPPPTAVTPPQEFLEEPLPAKLGDVFFDYDRYTIRADAIPVLEDNARLLLVRYPNQRIVIEGHCDERGTVEYNLALGAKRAQAVKNYLVDLGVPAENIDTISYGKEKPFCREHSLKCWQLNRRGHFVLK
ncbi:MAG: hypothetical protein D6690_11000 [Nitrospirae bacterium]|nr:MAG: hypothetical protein D6690_11000 [Nitrospirota bacterium]